MCYVCICVSRLQYSPAFRALDVLGQAIVNCLNLRGIADAASVGVGVFVVGVGVRFVVIGTHVVPDLVGVREVVDAVDVHDGIGVFGKR